MSSSLSLDRFLRTLSVVAVIVTVYAACSYLSSVLIPFIVAAVVAYILQPVCHFLQHTCRLRWRPLCVILTLAIFFGVVGGLLWLCLPPLLTECASLADVVRHYLEYGAGDNASIPAELRRFIEEQVLTTEMAQHLEAGDYLAILRSVVPEVWTVVYSTANALLSIVASMISLLYLFFLLLDYDRYARQWISFVPPRYRRQARRVVGDMTYYLCGYFRGQLLIALSNCVLFTLGFLLIDFPMPLALGCFIGLLSFVPYVQVVGFLPATLLALLRAAESHENFWVLIGGVVAVYLVVQIIQDTVVTPRIMGHIMGLSPAIILLALSIGAAIGGIGGLIIALPLTTIALLYYRRYVVGDTTGLPAEEAAAKEPEATKDE